MAAPEASIAAELPEAVKAGLGTTATLERVMVPGAPVVMLPGTVEIR